ncbi:hypothetical protein ACN28C_21570 [Plantactinospora sp. WMMC1484]|uniref:hypothetical protein n=1 Tax=Plantactinospora sp. WMMC1484 TaxID=3404122 RepID=UPI003BF4EBD5
MPALFAQPGGLVPVVVVVGLPGPAGAEPVPVLPVGVTLVALTSLAPDGPPAGMVGWRRWSDRLVVRVLEAGPDPVLASAHAVLAVIVQELGLRSTAMPGISPGPTALEDRWPWQVVSR